MCMITLVKITTINNTMPQYNNIMHSVAVTHTFIHLIFCLFYMSHYTAQSIYRTGTGGVVALLKILFWMIPLY
jgi:hypothetical protein